MFRFIKAFSLWPLMIVDSQRWLLTVSVRTHSENATCVGRYTDGRH